MKFKVSEWYEVVEEIASIAKTNQREAKSLVLSILPDIASYYGFSSKEYAFFNHQAGILYMLLGEYDKAETYLINAVELSSLIPDEFTWFSDLERHLSILYEVKSNLSVV